MRGQIYYEPKVTVLAAPEFTNPEHLPVAFIDETTSADKIAEYAGRVCYMSQANAAQRTTQQYLTNILTLGHGSVLEHASITYLIEGVSRALTHELIRHRVGVAISQLSQRYVDATDTALVCPPAFQHDVQLHTRWRLAAEHAVAQYYALCRNMEERPEFSQLPPTVRTKKIREAARAVLPNCTETKLVWTCNLRELRHVLLLRGSSHADAEIQQLAQALLTTTRPYAPAVLADLAWSDTDGVVSTL
jgi:thymidylate synthase (FAD)